MVKDPEKLLMSAKGGYSSKSNWEKGVTILT
jgi:hypothetical protein